MSLNEGVNATLLGTLLGGGFLFILGGILYHLFT